MTGRKKILIVTINDYVIYQPTILNLYDFLIPHFDVEIVSFEPQFISKKKDDTRNITYIRTGTLAREFFQKTDFILSGILKFLRRFKIKASYHYLYYNVYLPGLLRKRLKKMIGDIIIAVDIPALVVSQEIYGNVHFLSLEIDLNDPFYPKIDTNKIASVFIQNQIRLEHLFPAIKLKSFFVQNSPVYTGRPAQSFEKRDFVWAGTMLERFAVLECIEFFNAFPEFKLVLKGGSEKNTMQKIQQRYGHLLDQKRIVINQNYLPGGSFIAFLSQFRIGFCFYGWELIRSSFNYQTAPSGKLFMYMAAGVPVIACRIPGFTFIEEFGAGVLIDDYLPATIEKAVIIIEKDFEKYSEACYRVAEHFSFDTSVKPYIDFLLGS